MLSELEDGTRVSAETSRRLACDAGVVTIERDPDGSILDVGRKTRSVPPALRRALDARDRGCRFPDHSPPASGARGLRFTDAHHIRHWADGGATRLGNLVLLCRFHHRLVHEEGFRVEYPDVGHPTFYTPRGLPLPDAPRLPDIVKGPASVGPADPAPSDSADLPDPSDSADLAAPSDSVASADSVPSTDPVEALLAENRRRGIEPDYATARSTYKLDRDIPTSILFPAMEAAEGG